MVQVMFALEPKTYDVSLQDLGKKTPQVDLLDFLEVKYGSIMNIPENEMERVRWLCNGGSHPRPEQGRAPIDDDKIWQLRAEGLSTYQIGNQLGITASTVTKHIRRMLWDRRKKGELA